MDPDFTLRCKAARQHVWHLQVFRGWTQNTADLIHVRPHSMAAVRAAAYMPGSRILADTGAVQLQLAEGSLFSIASGCAGLLSKELQDLCAESVQCRQPARDGRHHLFTERSNLFTKKEQHLSRKWY